MTKRNYINPSVIRSAMQELEAFKAQGESKTPLFDFAKNEPSETRAIYVRAAQRLKWSVIRSRGHVYENGYFIW